MQCNLLPNCPVEMDHGPYDTRSFAESVQDAGDEIPGLPSSPGMLDSSAAIDSPSVAVRGSIR